MKKRPILKLNKHYLTCGVSDWREIVKNIFTNAVYPLDLWFSCDDNGNHDFYNLDGMDLIRSWEDWVRLPVREYDEWLNSVNGRVRLPSVVVCCDYEKIPFVRSRFPSKRNIWKRDNYTCLYTGKKLSKKELTVDHIKPRSKGGTDSWTNLATCSKIVNHVKGDSELGVAAFPKNREKYREWAGKKIKLKIKPTKPKFARDQIVFDNWREEWYHFVQDAN